MEEEESQPRTFRSALTIASRQSVKELHGSSEKKGYCVDVLRARMFLKCIFGSPRCFTPEAPLRATEM